MTVKILGREIRLRVENIVLMVALLGGILALTGFWLSKNKQAIVIKDVQANNTIKENSNAEPVKNNAANTSVSKNEEKIKVYVVGCVKKRGIVTLKKGQLIDDAIKAAGGASTNADIENINLVYELNQNSMLYIKPKTQNHSIKKSNASIPSGQNTSAGSGITIATDSNGAVVNATNSGTEGSTKININTASKEELDKLPGVGEKTAGDIIEYREKNGSFKKLEEIMNVPRIGEGRFKNIKELISI
jgi:competence protein ComEA